MQSASSIAISIHILEALTADMKNEAERKNEANVRSASRWSYSMAVMVSVVPTWLVGWLS